MNFLESWYLSHLRKEIKKEQQRLIGLFISYLLIFYCICNPNPYPYYFWYGFLFLIILCTFTTIFSLRDKYKKLKKEE